MRMTCLDMVDRRARDAVFTSERGTVDGWVTQPLLYVCDRLLRKSFSYRSRKCFFDAPSKLQTAVQIVSGRAEFRCPIGNAHSFAVVSKQSIRSLIAGLFRRGGPSTVTRFIVPIVVNALDRMRIGWPYSHVLNEIVESGFAGPSLANIDAHSSVSCISGHARITASTVHLEPWTVLCTLMFLHGGNYTIGRRICSVM